MTIPNGGEMVHLHLIRKMAKKLKSRELGFGTHATANGQRLMNADGSANVHRVGGPFLSGSDVFHKLTTMRWPYFLLVILTSFVSANLLFATLYFMIGIEHIGVAPTNNFFTDFAEAFFFSTQCFTTIGFGRINPQNFSSNLVSGLEGLAGLLSLAIATGLLYGRFSRPRAHLIHSQHLLIAPYRHTKTAVMFRIASTRRHSILIENTVSVSLGINIEEHGILRRRYFILDLELDKINFMNLSWTLVHPIDEESPLWGRTYEDLLNGRAEFIVLFKAVEETTSQVVMERFSYFVDEIKWGARFLSAIGTTEEGKPVLDLNKIDDWEIVDLPTPVLHDEATILTQSEASGS